MIINNNLNMRKLVGKVSEEERNEIRHLFERKNGLTELIKILDASNNELYEKVVFDMGETSTRFQGWWDSMIKKYEWEETEGGHWEIDFDSCDIYLIA